MRRIIASAWITSLLSISGCSLLIDTGPYLGGDPDGPTQPVVRIAPDAPTSADVLTAEIVTESTDPLGAGAVTYEYAWRVDGADAGITTATVTADRTEFGQEWTVSVTPVSADGERRGVPGTATVTIGGGVPTIGGVGLSQYRPVVGETIIALPGPTSDPDGDPVALGYAWFQNGAVIAGQTSNRLDLTAGTYAPGDRIEVEVTPRDMTGSGTQVRGGPAIVLEDVTRWRAILPQRSLNIASFLAYDPPNRRIVFGYAEGEAFDDVKVWEFAVTDTGGSFTELHPTGPDPALIMGTTVFDAANRRILVVGAQHDLDSGTATSEVYALDVSQRGNESWSVILPGGDVPPPRFLTTAAYDPARERVLMYGGMLFQEGGSATVINDMWALDVSTAGSETWTELTVPLPPTSLIGSNLVVDEASDRALLVGGGELFGAGEPVPSLAIYSLNLLDPSAGFFMESTTLPRPVLLAGAGVDRANGRALFTFGIDVATDGRYPTAIELELETLAASEITFTGDVPEGGGRGLVAEDTDGARVLIVPGAGFFDTESAFDLYALDPATDALDALHRTGVDLPPALDRAMAVGTWNGMRVFGGFDDNVAREEVWETDGSNRWMRVTTQPDALSGRTPGGRAAAVLQPWSPWGSDIQFFGGIIDGSNNVADSTMWHLQEDTWIEQTYSAGVMPPEGRDGAMFYTVACGGWRWGYFGGYDTFRTPRNDTGFLECTNGERDCSWFNPVAPGGEASARAWGTIGKTLTTSDIVLFGGEDGSTVLGDLWSFNVCGGGSQSWRLPVNVTGTAPSPRSRHSMSLVADDTPGAPTVFIVFGGSDQPQGFGNPFGDAYRLVMLGTDSFEWQPITPAAGAEDAVISPRVSHVATWDQEQRRLLVYGGQRRGQILGDFWELRVRP